MMPAFCRSLGTARQKVTWILSRKYTALLRRLDLLPRQPLPTHLMTIPAHACTNMLTRIGGRASAWTVARSWGLRGHPMIHYNPGAYLAGDAPCVRCGDPDVVC